ncbi:MAG: hypothetical protein H0X61_06765 [Acidimicrobiia bacterium]|nr:hypothetical protein [Chloroflexia bacterium]MBA3983225.1 hypothetical protein [Acidimicrobiia bacterium]
MHDGDPVAFVAACNVNRRHMMTGVRAMAVAVMLADADPKCREGGRWARGSVPEATDTSESGSWPKRIAEAGVVIDHAPDLAPLVIAGRRGGAR